MLAQTQFLTREINKVPDLDKRLFKFGIFFAMANYTKVHQSSPFCISGSAMESPFLYLLDAVLHHTQYYPPTHPSANFQQIASVSQNPFFCRNIFFWWHVKWYIVGKKMFPEYQQDLLLYDFCNIFRNSEWRLQPNIPLNGVGR